MRVTAIVRDRNTKYGAMPVDFRITAMSSDDLEEWHREVRQITDSVSEHLVAKYSDKGYEKKHLEFEYDRQSFQVEQSHDNEDLEHLKGQVWFTPISPMDAGFPPCRRRCCASPDETKERQRILIIILAVFLSLMALLLFLSGAGIDTRPCMGFLCSGGPAGEPSN